MKDGAPGLELDSDSFKDVREVLERLIPLVNINFMEYYGKMVENLTGLLSYGPTGSTMNNGVFAAGTIPAGVQVALFGGKLMPVHKMRSEEDAYVISNGEAQIPRTETGGKVLKIKTCIDGSGMLHRLGLNAAAFNHSCFEANCVMTNSVFVQVWSFESQRYYIHTHILLTFKADESIFCSQE